jgi:hypothetical protein
MFLRLTAKKCQQRVSPNAPMSHKEMLVNFGGMLRGDQQQEEDDENDRINTRGI